MTVTVFQLKYSVQNGTGWDEMNQDWVGLDVKEF